MIYITAERLTKQTPNGNRGACALMRHGPIIAIMRHHTALCDWCSAVATGRGAPSASNSSNRVNEIVGLPSTLLHQLALLQLWRVVNRNQRRSEAGSEMELMLEFGNFAQPAAHRWKIDNTKRWQLCQSLKLYCWAVQGLLVLSWSWYQTQRPLWTIVVA